MVTLPTDGGSILRLSGWRRTLDRTLLQDAQNKRALPRDVIKGPKLMRALIGAIEADKSETLIVNFDLSPEDTEKHCCV